MNELLTFDDAMKANIAARRPHWDDGIVAIRRIPYPTASDDRKYMKGKPTKTFGNAFMTGTEFWYPSKEDKLAEDWQSVTWGYIKQHYVGSAQ